MIVEQRDLSSRAMLEVTTGIVIGRWPSNLVNPGQTQTPGRTFLPRLTSAKGSLSRTTKVGNAPLFDFNPSSFKTGQSWPVA